mgnify:CR=1 FL=1
MKCPEEPIKMSKERTIINADKQSYPWPSDPKGYFLVKIEDGLICCGFVNKKNNEMKIELHGKNVEKMIKEIAQRKLCSTFETMGYIASELMIAKDALENKKEYVQR